MNLAERLQKALAESPGKTQAGLARACKIKPPSVNEWVSGRTKNIESTHLFDAARYLCVNAEWLGTGKGQMRPNQADTEENKLIIDTSDMSMERLQLIDITRNVPEDHIPQITKIVTTFDGVERRSKPRNKLESNSNK